MDTHMELEATPRHGVAKGEGDLRLRKTIPSEAFGGKPMNRRHAVCAGLCATIALISGFLYVTLRDNDYYDPRYLPGGWSADDDDDDDDNPIVRLKAELHRLSAAEAKRRFGEILPRGPAPPRQSKIDHFVVLYMENHAADNMFGCMDLPGFDGIRGHTIPKPLGGTVEVSCGNADYVCKSGPSYDTFAGKFGPGGKPHIYPYSPQSDTHSALHGASKTGQTAVKMYSPEQVPIKHAIAQNFGVFNKLYTAVPSASSPNHLFTQSATSCGMQHNGLYNDCLGPNVTFPQVRVPHSLSLCPLCALPISLNTLTYSSLHR